MTHLIELLTVMAVGLCFGSFITVAAHRLPLGQEIVRTPSNCPHCKTKLGFRDLWPVLSWLLSMGKCRHCAQPVSMRYPLTELATASALLLVYSRYGVSPMSVVLMLMAVALLVMIVADLQYYVIPDVVHYVLLPLGLAYHYIKVSHGGDVIGGLAIGLTLGLALHYGYIHLRKKDGLGFGDVKFLGVAGLWLGVQPIVPFLFLSGLLGVATGLLWRALKRGPIFPFGPALAVALFLCVIYPETMSRFWNIYNFMK